MSRNIVFEGWLTKSPPTKRIWRTKWRRRWFALRQSGDLPGQYFLDYYADRNGRRLKGTINLDLCEQVDAGLHMERGGNGSLDPKLRGSVFTIQTQSRTYHLEADCEAEMTKWVDAICRVCGLRPADEPTTESKETQTATKFQNSLSTVSAMNDNYECADGTGPYIPISECITGVRAQNEQRAFTFDPQNIVRSTRTPFDRVGDHRAHQIYTSQPHIRLNNIEFSETESNISDEECKSLNASQTNIREWPVGKSFTKLASSQRRNGVSEDGPPVPPRPPKTFALSREAVQKDTYQGPKVQEPIETQEHFFCRPMCARMPRRTTRGAPPLPGRTMLTPYGMPRYTDDEAEYLQHSELLLAREPRRTSHSEPPLLGRAVLATFGAPRATYEEEDYSTGHLSEPNRAQVPRRTSHSAPPSLGRAIQKTLGAPRYANNEDNSPGQLSMPIRAQVPQSMLYFAPPSMGCAMQKPLSAPRYTSDEHNNSARQISMPILAQVPRSSLYFAPPSMDCAMQKPLSAPRYTSDEHNNSDRQLSEPIWARVPRRVSPSLDRAMQKPLGAPRYTNNEDEISPAQHASTLQHSEPIWVRVPWRTLHGVPPSLRCAMLTPYGAPRYMNFEDLNLPTHHSMQYSNLPSLPPAVDRALKPRHSSHSIGHINHLFGLSGLQIHDDMKADVLQYLDLDLHTSKPAPNRASDTLRMKIDIAHGKSMSSDDDEPAYKTVDFLKTEAFNITRQDAEASRNNPH